MVDNRLYKIFLAFTSQLESDIKQKHPELSEDQRRSYVDIVLSRILLDPLRAVGNVSELSDSMLKTV